MKHSFTFLFCISFSFQMQAQQTLLDEDFETGWTVGATIIGVNPLLLQGWGTDFTFPVVNDAGNGASSSNYFGKIQRDGVVNFAVIQNVVELVGGKNYEYKISIKPAVAGQAGAYRLEVVDVVNSNSIVATQVKPSSGDWNDLTITYAAAASQNYAFRVTKAWGNAGADFDNISLVCTDCVAASVSDLNDFQFNIYPNPAKDVVSLTSELPISNVEVFSISGAKVIAQNEVNSIDISVLNKGIYILKVTTAEGKVATQKLIRQ